MLDVELRIAELLHQRKTYNQIAKELHVSPESISRVRKLMEEGAIVVGAESARRIKGTRLFPEKTRNEKVMELAYSLMRALGCSTPEEALKQACDWAVKVNPYMLYYGLKTPSSLISYLEGKIEELKRKLEEERNQDEWKLAKRLGLSGETLAGYVFVKQHRGFPGSLSDFLDICVRDVFRIHELEFEAAPSENGKTSFYLRRIQA